MSNIILILGTSGSGKSTAARTLNPDETFYINVIDKPLPYRGYKKKYNEEKKNYYATDDYLKIIAFIRAVNERRPDIKNIIIDDFNFILNNEYMRRARENGYTKFTEMGVHTFEIAEELLKLREDLFCFIMSHTEKDDEGVIKPQTVGKMVPNKVSIEGRITTVFHARVIGGEFKFLTQFDGLYSAKTPMGLFEDLYIDNDLQMIRDNIINYNNEEIEE